MTSARIAALAAALLPLPALAQTAEPISNVSEGQSRTGTRANLTLGGYVEAGYQWNFNQPSNGVTAYRGFDTRHNTFTLSNVVLDASGSLGPVSARLALQVGHTPETYYLAEPSAVAQAGQGIRASPCGSSFSRRTWAGARRWAGDCSSKRGSSSRPSAPRGW